MRKAMLAILLTLFVSTAAVRADDPKGDKPPGDKGAEKAAAAPAAPRKFVTHHRFTAGGVDIPYTATAEDIDLKDRDGKPAARFFTISYIAEGVKRQEDRPITFFFNGGPGSSSVWLHLGFVGPKRIDIPSDAQDPGAPPYRTGMSRQYILNSDLRLYANRFAKELLRDEGMATGFLDSRYAQKELDNASEFPNSDPFDAKTGPIYVSLFNQYLRNDLGADIQEPYLPQNGEANQPGRR